MSGPVRRVAVAGTATRWPDGPLGEACARVVVEAFDAELAKMPPGGTLILRHGGASRGPDAICHQWITEMIALMRTPGGSHVEPKVTLAEEIVPADWDNCVTEPFIDARGVTVKPCPPTVNGRPHRTLSPRSKAADGRICPSAGHRRNPDVVAHPEYPVHALHAWCINDSPGTEATIRAARRARVPVFARYYY